MVLGEIVGKQERMGDGYLRTNRARASFQQ